MKIEDFVFNFYNLWLTLLFPGYTIIRGRQTGNPPQPMRPFVMVDIQEIDTILSRKDDIVTDEQVGSKFVRYINQQYVASIQIVFFSDNSVSDSMNFELSSADDDVLQIAYDNGRVAILNSEKIPDSSSLSGPEFQSISVFDSRISFWYGRRVIVDAIEETEFTIET